MHHCVASYAHTINAGGCSIWRTEWDNKPYTIEVGLNATGYRLGQIKGVCNAGAPHELKKTIHDHLLGKDTPEELHILSQEEPEYAGLPF
jgi:hypothetical protein